MNNTLIIAEIAQAHDGSLGILHSYIDAVSKTGIDIIKFQTHIAEAESSEYEQFRVNFTKKDKTRFDYWKRMSFTPDEWQEIKTHCDEANVEFMSSPFSLAAVDILEKLAMKRYKIASGELSNYLMLEKIGRTGKPVLISSGMSSFQEIDSVINFLKPFGNELSLFQTTTAYPTNPQQVGLNVIQEMLDKYPFKIGLSDHSGTIFPSLAAVSIGASIIEVHAVFNKEIFGPDTEASLTIDQIAELVEGIRYIDKAKATKVDKNDISIYEELRVMFGKALAVNKGLSKGHELKFEDLESKKPL
ncbi:MAG: N-acetylneuraminate synthase family protein, partial [Bacteroidetes bacterium]|nr:N-acetylneuraminate synthase family protein [Bacteroidota bacterium]